MRPEIWTPEGIPFERFRAILRELALWDVAGFKKADFRSVAMRLLNRNCKPPEILREMINSGFVERYKDGYRLTPLALRTKTKKLARLKRGSIMRLLDCVKNRAIELRESSPMPFEIGEMHMLGSALDPTRPDYGDLDIAYYVKLKDGFTWETANARFAEIQSVPIWQVHPEPEIAKFIRNRRPGLHIVDLREFEEFRAAGAKTEVIYSAPSFRRSEAVWAPTVSAGSD
jgi:hypothetical protein